MKVHFSLLNKIASLTILFASSLTASCYADEDAGFSYFLGFGFQNLKYEESPSILPVKTRTNLTNPIVITGALYEINHDWLFSLDGANTFAPDSVREKWYATTNPFYGTALSSNLLQSNQFTFQQNSDRLQIHYRLRDQWFLISGPSLHSVTFKRSAFSAGPDNAVDIIRGQVIEETSSEVIWNLGVALESEYLVNHKAHYSAKLFYGMPVWRKTDNTLIPDHTFTSTDGHDVTLEGRYSFEVYPSLHIGGWLQWSVSERGGESACIEDPSPDAGGDITNRCDAVNPSTTLAERPDSKLTSFSYGVEALWKL